MSRQTPEHIAHHKRGQSNSDEQGTQEKPREQDVDDAGAIELLKIDASAPLEEQQRFLQERLPALFTKMEEVAHDVPDGCKADFRTIVGLAGAIFGPIDKKPMEPGAEEKAKAEATLHELRASKRQKMGRTVNEGSH